MPSQNDMTKFMSENGDGKPLQFGKRSETFNNNYLFLFFGSVCTHSMEFTVTHYKQLIKHKFKSIYSVFSSNFNYSIRKRIFQ